MARQGSGFAKICWVRGYVIGYLACLNKKYPQYDLEYEKKIPYLEKTLEENGIKKEEQKYYD